MFIKLLVEFPLHLWQRWRWSSSWQKKRERETESAPWHYFRELSCINLLNKAAQSPVDKCMCVHVDVCARVCVCGCAGVCAHKSTQSCCLAYKMAALTAATTPSAAAPAPGQRERQRRRRRWQRGKQRSRSWGYVCAAKCASAGRAALGMKLSPATWPGRASRQSRRQRRRRLQHPLAESFCVRLSLSL